MPGSPRITMRPWSEITAKDMWLQAAGGLPLVLRICEYWWWNRRLLPGSSCRCSRFPLAPDCKHSLVSLLVSHLQLGSIIFLTFPFHLSYHLLLHGCSPILCARDRWDHLTALLLHCCSVRIVTSCHRVSRGWVRCLKASAVVRQVHSGSSLRSWWIVRRAVAHCRCSCGSPYLSVSKSFFQFEPPRCERWLSHGEHNHLNSFINLPLTQSFHWH